MDRIAVDQPQVLVLVEEDGTASANKRGHLFEKFVAQLLHTLGYAEPTSSDINVTSSGIEIDVSTRHRLTATSLIAECKSYSSNVPAHEVDAFFGKVARERFADSQLHGLFVALPRLTANGEEQARTIQERDPAFTYLNGSLVARQLEADGRLTKPPADIGLLSDPMVLITEHGLYQAALRLDHDTRTADAVVVWSPRGTVPSAVESLVRHSAMSDGLPVLVLGDSSPAASATHADEPVIVPVRESTSDFHYQLPAAPKYFVGRKDALSGVKRILLAESSAVLVFNAQSGWGKSSLALRVGRQVEQARGRALVLDSRTATTPAYVPAALKQLADKAVAARILKLPGDAAFGTISSSLRSLQRADWASRERPLLLFFDQFENVFRNIPLTQAFRDLALVVRDVDVPLKVGFAWKTDLVGWTEGHPYQLRDEIRGSGDLVVLSPLGPAEISTLLKRLQEAVGQRLDRDLRDRLREYSGGLPWLFKKLASHVIDELGRGAGQADLVAEALNVQGLFDADLAELNPSEASAIREIARSAPVAISDVSESIDSPVIQSLLDRRLIVQVGERLDTYWDIFRDYLVTGTVPIKDAFILRLNPSSSMGLLLRTLIERGGSMSTSDAMELLNTSESVIYNTVRELRMLGLVSYEPGEIHIHSEALSSDPERALRARASATLRRHRAFDVLIGMLGESDLVAIGDFAEELSAAFPAVTAKSSTWNQYARAFGYWFAYAGLIGLSPSGITAVPAGTHGERSLLDREGRVSVSNAFPQSAAGPAIELASAMAAGMSPSMPEGRRRKAESALRVLGLLTTSRSGEATLDGSVFQRSGIDRPALREVLEQRIPGAEDALKRLEADPSTDADEIGAILRNAQQTSWSVTTTRASGKHFRSWAREVGVATAQSRERGGPQPPSLFDEPTEAAE